MVDGGPIDVLTGDWLAELTMLILAKDRAARPDGRLRPHVRHPDGAGAWATASTAASRSCPTPAGSTPAACAEAVQAVADKLGLSPDDRVRRGRRSRSTALAELRAAGHAFANLDTGAPLGDQRRC